MKQNLFLLYEIAKKFMLRVWNVVINKCGRAESPGFQKQAFEGLDFLAIKCKSRSRTWWNWRVRTFHASPPGCSCASLLDTRSEWTNPNIGVISTISPASRQSATRALCFSPDHTGMGQLIST